MPEPKKIPMFEVQSSNIQSIGYDPNSLTLRIQFKGDSVYDYVRVPPGKFSEIMSSDSQGKFFYAQIKGKYDCTKLDI